MAVVAVAAHLTGGRLGETGGLERLADRYKHDVKSLDQVGGGRECGAWSVC